MAAKLVALAIGLSYAVGAWTFELETDNGYWYFVAIVVAEFLIWFPEQLGSVTGMGFSTGPSIGGVDKESPGCVVAAYGWLQLLAVPVVYFGT